MLDRTKAVAAKLADDRNAARVIIELVDENIDAGEDVLQDRAARILSDRFTQRAAWDAASVALDSHPLHPHTRPGETLGDCKRRLDREIAAVSQAFKHANRIGLDREAEALESALSTLQRLRGPR